MANQGTHEKILRDRDRPGDARSRWGAHGGREGGWAVEKRWRNPPASLLGPYFAIYKLGIG
jgi:hypothetical protein